MNTFQALAALLTYPTGDLTGSVVHMKEILARENLVGPEDREALEPLFSRLATADIYDLQAVYVELFDQSRSCSLHLFEHVHGESRDRGQAMVDLLQRYREAGLELSSPELPDFLPVFLEYLSQLPPEEARSGLGEAVAVVAALARRVAKRGSPYAAVLATLEHLAQVAPDPAALQELESEERALETAGASESGEALDAEWQEEPVDFSNRERAFVGRQRARTLGAAARKSDAARRAGGEPGITGA